MIQSVSVVLALVIAGEAIAARFNLPFPGTALGLLALSTVFAMRSAPDRGSEELFDFAAPNFPLFFLPAAVGVIGKVDVLASGWLPVVVAVIPGTALTLLLTGHVFQALTRQRAEGVDA